MSADIAVFHGSEIDDRSLLPGEFDAWYIGVFAGDENEASEIIGPYATKAEAAEAMVLGVWVQS